MYNVIKIHNEFVYKKDIPQSSCFCELCENAVFVSKSIGTFKNIVPSNPNDLIETYLYSSARCQCICQLRM